jgi:putative sigma-54 modulation protein
MNISITGRKIKITPEIRRHIEKNMKKLDHYIDHILDFKLVLRRERHTYFAEVNINVKRKIIHIFSKTEDASSVIDTLFDKIEVKIRRYHDKLINRRSVSDKESFAESESAASAV